MNNRETESSLKTWLTLSVLCLSVVLPMATWFSTTAIVPELKSAWSLTNDQAAWLTNAVQLGFVSGALLASLINLPDIVRLNRLIAAASLFAACTNALVLAEPTYPVVILLRFLTGAALAGVYPPAMKLISTWFIRNRGLALGAVVGALTLGSALPHLFRAVTEQIDWRFVMILSSSASALSAVLFLLFAQEGPYPFGRAVFNPRQIGKVLRDRDLLLVNIGYFGHMWELYAMWAWLLIFIREAGSSFSAAFSSFAAFLAIGSGLFGCLIAGFIADRFGRASTAAGFLVVSGICCLVSGFIYESPSWVFIPLLVIWGVAIVGDSPLFSTAVTELSDRTLIGTALSLQMGFGFALTVLAIWLMPQIHDLFGSWQWVFLVLAPGPIIGAWAMLKLHNSPSAQQKSAGRI